MRQIWQIVVMFGLMFGAMPAVAAGPPVRPPAHVEIVLDTSGSMRGNDGRRLSALAAMLFADLAESTDSLGIYGMMEYRNGYSLRPLGPVGTDTDSIKRTFRDVPYNSGTDCAGPLQRAAEELEVAAKQQPNAEQFVIFLTDGLCPNEPTDASADPLGTAAQRLAKNGVKVFTIGLFLETETFEKDPELEPKRLERITGGQYYRLNVPTEIPQRFAQILGSILGSQAQPVEFDDAGKTEIELDGYLVDASLIVTSAGNPAAISEMVDPNDRTYGLPSGRPPFQHIDKGLRAIADGNGRDQFYEVVRLEKPVSGTWRVSVDGPAGTRGILIQNYALDPVLELPEKADKYKIGESIKPVVYLRGPEGNRISDAEFLKKVSFSLESTSPSGKTEGLDLAAQPDGSSTGTLKLTEDGEYRLSARAAMKAGGLDKETDPITIETMALELAVASNQGPIDFGTVRAGETSEKQTVDLSASKVGSTYALTIELELTGDGDIENMPDEAPISPDSQMVEVAFEVDTDHPGGKVDGTLEIRFEKQKVRVPVTGNVIPLTFWERFGKLIMALGAGLLGLLFLMFIIMGFVRPYSFSPAAKVKYGESMKKLQRQKPMQIVQIRGTKKGFYRNARLFIGGSKRPFLFSVGSEPIATLTAVGPNLIEISAGEGVELREVNSLRPDRENDKVIASGSDRFRSGKTYRLGKYIIEIP